jgi:PAS domain S-box-containing protein
MAQDTAEQGAARALDAHLPLWRCRPDGQRDHVSAGWRAFTGRSTQQELGSGWTEGVHPDDREGCRTAIQAAIASRAPFSLRYRLRRHDGAYRLMLDRGVPFTDAAGAFAGYVGACMDIQDEVQAMVSAPLALAAAPLSELQGMTLNVVQTAVALLDLKGRRLRDEAAAAPLRAVARYMLAMGIVQQQLSRRVKRGEVELGRYLAALGRALLDVHGRPDLRLLAQADPIQVTTAQASTLGLIVNELLANSIRHAFPGREAGTVRIEVRRLRNGGAEVVVADDGIGLDPALYPFGQDGSTGMALIAALARQAKARVEVEGQGGTRFTVTLPDDRAGAADARMARRRRRGAA